MKKLIINILFMTIILAALGLTACSSNNEWDNASFDETQSLSYAAQIWEVAEEAPASTPHPQSGGADQVGFEDIAGQGQRHIIQTASVDMETEYFQKAVTGLRAVAAHFDGYIAKEELTARGWRMFTIVLRIPTDSFDEAMSQIGGIADIRTSFQWAQDVTEQFYDMVGSLEVRRIEEDRLLALLDEAQTISEILALEQRLSNTRLSIEMYLSQLNTMAGQIAYSTINVTLFDIFEEEVIVINPTLGDRIGGAFGDSARGSLTAFQDVIVFLAGAIIPIILLSTLGLAAYKITRVSIRRREAR